MRSVESADAKSMVVVVGEGDSQCRSDEGMVRGEEMFIWL